MGRKRTAERESFLRDVLLTAIQGCHYWAEVEEYNYEEGRGTLLDNEGDPHTFNLDTIAKGIGVLTTGENADRAFSMCGMDYWKQFKLANRTNGVDGDYDSDIADNVLQAGLFGEIVYG